MTINNRALNLKNFQTIFEEGQIFPAQVVILPYRELTQFITAVNSFHPALKYIWEISDTSLAFVESKISVEGNVLCTNVY